MMKTNKSHPDNSKQGKAENKVQGGKNAPDITSVPKAAGTGQEAGGTKPRGSGRQGSTDVQDGGQDTGSSAGSH